MKRSYFLPGSKIKFDIMTPKRALIVKTVKTETSSSTNLSTDAEQYDFPKEWRAGWVQNVSSLCLFTEHLTFKRCKN